MLPMKQLFGNHRATLTKWPMGYDIYIKTRRRKADCLSRNEAEQYLQSIIRNAQAMLEIIQKEESDNG